MLSQLDATQFASIGLGNYLWNNLIPVSLGNIVGGAGFVGLAYWFIYLRKPHPSTNP